MLCIFLSLIRYQYVHFSETCPNYLNECKNKNNLSFREIDALEASIGDRRSVDEDTMAVIEEKFESLVPYYQSAKNTGLTFINETNRVSFSTLCKML